MAQRIEYFATKEYGEDWSEVHCKSALAEQQKEIKALTESLEKVSARMEAQETAPRLVTNH